MFAAVCAGFLWRVPAAASAAAAVSVHAGVGFQRYFDPRVWTPVRVSASDPYRRPVTATISFRVGGAGRYPYDGRLFWTMRLVPGKTARLTIGVPGYAIASGGRIELAAPGFPPQSVKLVGASVAGTEMAGIVSNHAQSVQFLAGVTAAGGVAQLVAPYIEPDQLPSSPQLLQGLTYLYIDGSAAAELSAGQVRAVLDWVHSGGILILGGIEPNAGQTPGFLSVSPVQPQIVLDQRANAFARFASAAPPKNAIPLLYGRARPGVRVLAGTRGMALLATRPLGRGKLVYLGTDATSPELVSWSGNAVFWNTLLRDLRTSIVPASLDLFGPDGNWTLMSAAEQFPQLHLPPLYLWEGVFAVYILLAGPVTFWVLRRRRRHEWAWVCLPALSVVLSACVYEVGTLQRPAGILTQSVGLIDIADAHHAQIVGMEAMMSPQTRTYAVRMPSGTWAAPLAERLSGAPEDAVVRFGAGGAVLRFSSVRAWGGRFAYAVRSVRHFGQMEGQLFESAGSVGGYVTNDTGLNMADAAIVVRGHVVPLGRLARGQSARVEWTGTGRRAARSSLAAQLAGALPSSARGMGRMMFAYAERFAAVSVPVGDVLFIGWSHAEPNLFRVNGPAFPATPQWVVRQVLPLTEVVQ